MSWLLDLILRRVRERIKLKLSLWLVLSGNVGLLSCHRFQTIRTPTSSGIFGLENPSPYPLLPIRSALLPFGGIFRLFGKLGIRFAQQSYEGSSERDSISTVDVAFEGGFT